MKNSLYNIVIKNRKKDNYLLYNASTNILKELPEKYINKKNGNLNLNLEILTQSDIKELYKDGILCDNPDDQKYEFIKRDKEIRQPQSNYKELSMVILPNYSCNCKCFYCFEPENINSSKSIPLNDEVEKKIINLVIKQITELRLERLSIEWFGGEPLLGLNRIMSVQSKVNELCYKNNVKNRNSIITNGLLLNNKAVKNLLNVNITQAQVTIDGPRNTHNQRKIFKKDPSGNFDIILKNLKESDERFTISIRINVDKNNIDEIPQLIDQLIEEKVWPYKKNIRHITLGHLLMAQESKMINELSNEKFEVAKDNLRYLLYSKYNSIFPGKAKIKFEYPSLITNIGCGYNIYTNAWVIDPSGQLFRCWEHVGYNDNFKSHIDKLLDENANSVDIINNLLNGKIVTPEKREKYGCNNCIFLPICGSHCMMPFNYDKKKRACSPWRYAFKQKLLNQINFFYENPQFIKAPFLTNE